MIIRYYLKVIAYLEIITYWKKKGIFSNSIYPTDISVCICLSTELVSPSIMLITSGFYEDTMNIGKK